MWNLSNSYQLFDQFRRIQGHMLDIAGLAANQTRYRVALQQTSFTLRDYGANQDHAPVLFIIPAPIKSPTIWDLAPEVSVIQYCQQQGIHIFLIEWHLPGPQERKNGLAEYADSFLHECLDAIRAKTGSNRIFLAGHSLGGILATISTALHPQYVQGLILASTPLNFGSSIGTLGAVVAKAPPAQTITAQLGNVPGTVLNRASVRSDPQAFLWDLWKDQIDSLVHASTADPEAWLNHLRVVRWTRAEMPMPQRLFEEVVEWLYRENRLILGTLQINGKPVTPEQIAVPLLSIVDKRCTIVPPEAVLPFHNKVKSQDTTILWYSGDIGVAFHHVGMLVGRTAHQQIWPNVLYWMQEG